MSFDSSSDPGVDATPEDRLGGRLRACGLELRRWQQRSGWLVTIAPKLVAAMAVLGLLMTFQHVVHDGVEQGRRLRQALALHADEAWGCLQLQASDSRQHCLAIVAREP